MIQDSTMLVWQMKTDDLQESLLNIVHQFVRTEWSLGISPLLMQTQQKLSDMVEIIIWTSFQT